MRTGRPAKASTIYKVSIHDNGGRKYASTQPFTVDDDGKKHYTHKHWGIVDDDMRFHPNSTYFYAPIEERRKLIFPAEWDLSEFKSLSGTGHRGAVEYEGGDLDRMYGPTWFLDNVARETGLTDDLRKVFDGNMEMAQDALTLAYYLFLESRTYSHIGKWRRVVKTPSVHTLTSGFFASKTLGLDLDPMEAKSRYGMRDEQEKTFMLQKGPLGEDRLRVCTESSKHGRMFICFVALILASYIRHIRGTKPELTKAFPSMAAILEGMQTIRCIEHDGRRKFITPFVGDQVTICDAFGFEIPEGCGVFVNGQWQVKNLKFLAEFMNQTGLTTGGIAKGVGLVRNSVTRWFMVDDTTLSRIITAADYYGYDFIISYTVPVREIEGTRLVIEKPARPIKAPGKRLDFIREAMKSAAITNEALAQKQNVIRNTVQLWFKKDDITISNIYKIAEGYGWEVNITFKLKNR